MKSILFETINLYHDRINALFELLPINELVMVCLFERCIYKLQALKCHSFNFYFGLSHLYFDRKHYKVAMDRKTKILPVLSCSKPKTTLAKDKLKIEELVSNNLKNRPSHKDYRF